MGGIAGILHFSGDPPLRDQAKQLATGVAHRGRDRKGLYKLAREGKIKEFTGISDPYDVPQDPELSVETENVEVDNCAHQVILKLESMGLISA